MARRSFWCLALLVSVLGFAANGLAAEKRIALVIGIGDYSDSSVAKLPNPSADAKRMKEVLSRADFNDVQLVIDKDRIAIGQAVNAFIARLAAAGEDGVGFFYFAGHGLQEAGENWLIPKDARLKGPNDLDLYAINFQQAILKKMRGAKTKLNIVVLDACRNFPAGWHRSLDRGLSPVAIQGEEVIVYSTDQGDVAPDGPPGGNSPFTELLSKEVAESTEAILPFLRSLKRKVRARTGKAPYVVGFPDADFRFHAPTVGQGTAAQSAPDKEQEDVLAALNELLNSQNPADYEAFLKTYPDATATTKDIVVLRLSTLKSVQMASSSAPRSAVADASFAFDIGRSFRDCEHCPEMTVVPPGPFQLGSAATESGRDSDEGPQSPITFARPFAVGKFEVTFEEWDACVTDKGCSYIPEARWGRGRMPVMNVSWNDANSYIAWLSSRTGKAYRLLSEAEWEYAARGGTTSRYPWGESASKTFANFQSSRAVAAGSYQPNGFGLHDMIGNIREWVQDCWSDSYAGQPAEGGPRTGGDCSRRVLRGGAWYYFPLNVRSADRQRDKTDARESYNGFRVARDL